MTFGIKEECVLQLTSKFGWSVKLKLIQELEWGNKCVGSDISWWKLCKDVKVPRIMVNKELVLEAVLYSTLRSSSKSDRKFSNLVMSWFGDL